MHVIQQLRDVDDSLIDDHAGNLARVRFVNLLLDEGEEEVAHQSAALVPILSLIELLEVKALRQLPADLGSLGCVGEVHLRLGHGLLLWLVPWLLLLVLHLRLGLRLRLMVLVSLLLVLTLLALIVVTTALIVEVTTATTALEIVAAVVVAGAALAVLVLLLLVLPAVRLTSLVLVVVLTLVVVLGLGTLLLVVASLVLLAL